MSDGDGPQLACDEHDVRETWQRAGIPVGRHIPKATATDPRDGDFGHREAAGDVRGPQRIPSAVGYVRPADRERVVPDRERSERHQDGPTAVPLLDGKRIDDGADVVAEYEIGAIDGLGCDGLVETYRDRIHSFRGLAALGRTDVVDRGRERVFDQVEHELVGQRSVTAGVERASLQGHGGRRGIGAERDPEEIEREGDVGVHEHAVDEQIHASHLEVVGNVHLHGNRGALDHLHARSARIEVRHAATQGDVWRQPLIVERQVVDHLQARGPVCDETDTGCDGHAARWDCQCEPREERERIRRIGGAHEVGHPIPASDTHQQHKPRAVHGDVRLRCLRGDGDIGAADQRGAIHVGDVDGGEPTPGVDLSGCVGDAVPNEETPSPIGRGKAQRTPELHIERRDVDDAQRPAAIHGVERMALEGDVGDRSATERKRLEDLPRE